MTRTFKQSILFLSFLLSFSFAHAEKNPNVFSVSGKEVPTEVMSVMDYCTSVWSQYIATNVPINVSVSWQELKSNVNAYAKPTTYYSFNGIYYPAALAEKIKGTNLNGSNPDIEVVINKNMNWSLDVDATPAEKQYDLATTLIHELAHGLGLIGNITEETLESSEFSSPTIYDVFICDSTKAQILQCQTTPFTIKNDVLCSDSLFWGGQFAYAYCGEYLELYAPTTFNSGSTAYHLHEDRYPTGSGYELMTPVLRSTEIIHKPDVATLGMLADIGWNDYFVAHSSPKNNSNLAEATKISFAVSDTLRNNESQFVFYSFDNGNHFVKLQAVYNSENQMFEAEIPAFQFDHTISYYILSVTTNNDSLILPKNTLSSYYTTFVGIDAVAPEIAHTPITSIATNKESVEIVATITDNFAIEKALVEYELGGQDIFSVAFTFEGDVATATIPLSGDLTAGDVLRYRIFAMDASENTAYFDEDNGIGAWQIVQFEEPQEPVTYFVTNFDDEDVSNAFILDKCSIEKVDGFSNKALHTAHPYAYTGVDGKYNQYTATLKQPIIIASNPATMSFDEVVLVEPGKAGIEYGTFGFWDYVIVEASKNIDSDNWYALGKIGWDSQLADIWKTRYYSNTKNDGDNENSLAVGDSTLFRHHTINLLENKYFRTGDTVYVRFRLQSDATNYAWGWAIDNLKIQEKMATAVPFISNVQIVYPNPCENELHISVADLKMVRIYSRKGALVLQSQNNNVDVTSLPSDMYIIVIERESGNNISTEFIKH